MTTVEIAITLQRCVTDADREIEWLLTKSLRRNVPPNDALPMSLTARGPDGALLGGLVGSTSYGWLLVKLLWVAEPHRNRGLGETLVRRAEAAARAAGCHGAWLDTSSGRAERFYRRLGYAPFGVLDNKPGESPQGHSRFFLSKRLRGMPENRT